MESKCMIRDSVRGGKMEGDFTHIPSSPTMKLSFFVAIFSLCLSLWIHFIRLLWFVNHKSCIVLVSLNEIVFVWLPSFIH